MTPDLASYWLLDAAALGRPPLQWPAAENLCELFNTRRGHGLSLPALTDVLEHLFQTGDVIAERLEENEFLGEFVPTRPDIVAGLTGQVRLFYGLTAQGGARWEALARPEWSLYIDVGYWTDATSGEKIAVGEIIAQEQHAVEQFRAALYAHYVDPDSTIHSDSERWDLVVPWCATYWKTLPQGYRLRFTYHEETDRSVRHNRLLQAQACPPAVKHWLESVRTPNWYARDW
jgi:hypothetical protein